MQKDFPVYIGKKASTKQHALVKNLSPLEASCILGAKHGQFYLNKGIDL
jgi:hypothetical protein